MGSEMCIRDSHRVVAPNLFGAGGTSPWPPHGRPQTLDDTAALVETAAKDALGDDDRPPIIVGHSHGAAVALRYAATREVACCVRRRCPIMITT